MFWKFSKETSAVKSVIRRPKNSHMEYIFLAALQALALPRMDRTATPCWKTLETIRTAIIERTLSDWSHSKNMYVTL